MTRLDREINDLFDSHPLEALLRALAKRIGQESAVHHGGGDENHGQLFSGVARDLEQIADDYEANLWVAARRDG